MTPKIEPNAEALLTMRASRNAVETAIDLSRTGQKATWDGVATRTRTGSVPAKPYIKTVKNK